MKVIKKVLSIFIVSMMIITSMAVPAFGAVDTATLDAAIKDTAAYMYKTVSNPQVGSIGGEWAVLGLARSGYNVPEEYYE